MIASDRDEITQATERWFVRQGLPHAIEDYSATGDVFTRAAPFLSLVFLLEVFASFDDRFQGWGQAVVFLGSLAILAAAVVDDIRGAGGEASFVRADMAVPADIDAMVAAVVDRHGRLDLACNNAGIFDRMHDLHTYGDDAWDTMIAVNLSGVFRCMRAEIAAMLPAGGGAIVNVASTVGSRGSERAGPAYVAAKHGVLGLTRQAAVQYADRGVRINAVSPGPTRTAVTDALVAEGPVAVQAALAGLNPRGAFITVEQVAATVAFLCSPAAEMINGHDIVIDGGQTAKL